MQLQLMSFQNFFGQAAPIQHQRSQGLGELRSNATLTGFKNRQSFETVNTWSHETPIEVCFHIRFFHLLFHLHTDLVSRAWSTCGPWESTVDGVHLIDQLIGDLEGGNKQGPTEAQPSIDSPDTNKRLSHKALHIKEGIKVVARAIRSSIAHRTNIEGSTKR